MEYHRIPQHVTGYEGRIIGKFTARQFIYLAIGGVIVFILAGLPINGIYKILMGSVVAGISILLSLVTYEGRNTDIWLVNYLRAVFHPTQRIWTKHEFPPAFLLPGYHPPKTKKTMPTRDRAEVEGLFRRLGKEEGAPTDLTNEEQAALRRISKLQTKQLDTPSPMTN